MTDNEDRLRHALRAGSGYRPTSDADRAAFDARLAHADSHQRRQSPHPRRWRAPLIAAAAVAAIAVAATAAATGGFGIGRHVASGPAAGDAVAVPIACAPDVVGPVAGSAGGTGGASTPHTSGAPPTTSTARGCASPGTVTLSFAGGAPPAATLHGAFRFAGGRAADGGTHHSDGTALGYLSVSGAMPDGTSTYLWGAVGPAVAQVQIQAPRPPSAGDIDPRFDGGLFWIIDSGRGTAFSLPEAADAVWTDLGGGWHGFAVRLPAGSTPASVAALGSGGQPLQFRTFDAATGRHFDRAVLSPTTVNSPAGTVAQDAAPGGPPDTRASGSSAPGTSAPEASESGGPASSTRITADETAGCHFSGGNGFGISDSGFDLASIEFQTNPDGSGVCFFDGDAWWNLTNDGLTAQLTIATTGVGTFASQVKGHPATKGRFVWGVLGSSIASVTVSVDGSGHADAAEVHDVTPSVRVFLARIPAAGDITVVAKGSDGKVIARAGTAGSALSTGSAADSGSAPPVVATYPDQPVQAGWQAALTGTISVTSGCVTVTDGAGTAVTPVFPASQVARAQPPAALVFRGSSYAEGDRISLTGGFPGSRSTSLPSGGHFTLPSGCPASAFVVSPGD